MSAKALDLFQAYAEGKLPQDSGFIVSSFFDESSTYSIYEIVNYSGVKNLYLTEEGLTFQTDGNKLYVLVEPPTYPKKFMEPVSRERDKQIPHRFNELEIFSAKNQTRIMVGKKPVVSYSSFTILKPTGVNFSLCFYNREDVLDTMKFFFTQTLNREAGVPQADSKKGADYVVQGIKKFGLW